MQVLDEMQEASIAELLVLAPTAGRERVRELLEKCDWNASNAACELLAVD